MPTPSMIPGPLYRRGYAAVNYRLRNLASGRWAGRCRPTTIMLLLTKRCQSRCVHCDIWKLREHEGEMEPEEWIRVLTDLRRWLGPVHVVLTGGEAMLQPHAPVIAAHGSRLGLWIEVLTNGYWPDQSRIEALARARPGRVTVSLDGIGEAHARIRGREDFFERTDRTIQTLARLRREEGLGYEILLKTVVMSHNLDDLGHVAEYATRAGTSVLYQPIEQNYETPEDPDWYRHSPNWPEDPDAAVATVRRLGEMKREGLPIANTATQLDAMVRYFQDPAGLRVTVQAHRAHEKRKVCGATTNLQVNPNGDVVSCFRKPPIGNVCEAPIRRIWERRPAWWRSGCCMDTTARSEETAREHVEVAP